MTVHRTRQSIAGLSAIVLLVLSAAAQAQHAPVRGADQLEFNTLLAEELLPEEGPWAALLTVAGIPNALAGRDLPAMTEKEWKALQKKQLKALSSEDEHTWQEALQNIIYLSHFYGNEIDFRGGATPMLEIYMFDREERHRVLALVALHAVGHANVMAHLAQRVQLEPSPRVRRLTLAALADYYGLRSYHGSFEGAAEDDPLVTESPEAAQRQ